MSELFLDKLVDWRDFEKFVRDLYDEDESLEVEHNVMLVGRSGAQRQIDVLFKHQAGGHEYLTLVECKRWKEDVSRDRIDVLVASVNDLNASKGVMFTTTGYEPGAEAYAKDQGIELFLVRDLTDEEWGLPGREIWFYMHIYAAKFINFKPGRAQAILAPGMPVPALKLAVQFGPNETPDPSLQLYTLAGQAGEHVSSLLIKARRYVLDSFSQGIELLADGANGATGAFIVPVRWDLSTDPARFVPVQGGRVGLEDLAADLLVTISQSKFELDRGKDLDFALAVEHFMSRERRIVARRQSEDGLGVFPVSTETPDRPEPSEILRNGSLMQIFTEPYVETGPVPAEVARQRGVRFKLPNWAASFFDE